MTNKFEIFILDDKLYGVRYMDTSENRQIDRCTPTNSTKPTIEPMRRKERVKSLRPQAMKKI